MITIFCQFLIKINNIKRSVITSAFPKKKSTSPIDDFFPKDGTDPGNEWEGMLPPS